MIGADQACKIEGFGRSIQSNDAVLCIFVDGLQRNMLIAVQDNVRPDLIRYDIYVVLLVDLHGFFELSHFPNTSGGIMGRAEDGSVDIVLHDLLFHVIEIHAPDAVLILNKLALHNVIAVVHQG